MGHTEKSVITHNITNSITHKATHQKMDIDINSEIENNIFLISIIYFNHKIVFQNFENHFQKSYLNLKSEISKSIISEAHLVPMKSLKI